MNQEGFESGKTQLKYHSKNVIYNYLVNTFNHSVKECLNHIKKVGEAEQILEIGVGEGQITEIGLSIFQKSNFYAADIAKGILEVAENNLATYKNQVHFEIQDIKKMSYPSENFDLVICCEVLEHVPNPNEGLAEIYRVLKKGGFGLLSVPNEPIWRILNMARGYYWKDWGNTPGHVNHWSSSKFRQFIKGEKLEIIHVKNPLPWTMLLVEKE